MVHKILPNKIISLVLIFFCFVFNKCSGPLTVEKPSTFKMFYLKDSTITYAMAEELPLKNLELQTNSFIEAMNIDTLEVLYLEGNPIQSYHILLKDSSDLHLANDVRPFVIVLNDDRFCIAEYWPAFMSIVPKSIFMYRMFDKFLALHPGDEKGNSTLKKSQIIKTLTELGVVIRYINIGGN